MGFRDLFTDWRHRKMRATRAHNSRNVCNRHAPTTRVVIPISVAQQVKSRLTYGNKFGGREIGYPEEGLAVRSSAIALGRRPMDDPAKKYEVPP